MSEVEPTTGPEPDQSPTFPGILVLRKRNEQTGDEEIEVHELNGIDPLSVPTLLQIAAKIRRGQLGI